MRQLVGVADCGDAPPQCRGLRGLGFGGQEGCHRLRAGWQSGNTLSLAPSLEQPEVGPVGLAGAERLLGPSEIHRSGEVWTKRSGQVLGGLDNGKGC
jgi:hypothetical protein